MPRTQLRIQQGDDELHDHGGLHPVRGVLRHGKHDEGHDEEHDEERGEERRLSCIQHSLPGCSHIPACGSGKGRCVRTRKPGEDCGRDGERDGQAGIGHIHRQYQTRGRTPWRNHGGCQPMTGLT